MNRQSRRHWRGASALVFGALAILEVIGCLLAYSGIYEVGPRGRFQTVRYNTISGSAWVMHAEDRGGFWSPIDERELRAERPSRREMGKRPWNPDDFFRPTPNGVGRPR